MYRNIQDKTLYLLPSPQFSFPTILFYGPVSTHQKQFTCGEDLSSLLTSTPDCVPDKTGLWQPVALKSDSRCYDAATHEIVLELEIISDVLVIFEFVHSEVSSMQLL